MNHSAIFDPATRWPSNPKEIKHKGICCDFRRVEYEDQESGKVYQFLANSLNLAASEVAALGKERWQIELFFKWIKQQLKVKTLLGTSRNAVLTQLWIALCVYLVLLFQKFKAKARRLAHPDSFLQLCSKGGHCLMCLSRQKGSTHCFSAIVVVGCEAAMVCGHLFFHARIMAFFEAIEKRGLINRRLAEVAKEQKLTA